MLCVSAGNRMVWGEIDIVVTAGFFCFASYHSPLYFMGGQGYTITVSYSSFRYSWVTPLAYFTLMSPALKSNTLCRWIYLYVANWQLFSIRRRLTEAVHKTERALNRVLCKRGIYSHLIPMAFRICHLQYENLRVFCTASNECARPGNKARDAVDCQRHVMTSFSLGRLWRRGTTSLHAMIVHVHV